MDLVPERPTIDAMLVKSNRNMSSIERDLLKMGLSQGTIVEVAGRVFARHGLRVHLADPRGTSSTCVLSAAGRSGRPTTTRTGTCGDSGGARRLTPPAAT